MTQETLERIVEDVADSQKKGILGSTDDSASAFMRFAQQQTASNFAPSTLTTGTSSFNYDATNSSAFVVRGLVLSHFRLIPGQALKLLSGHSMTNGLRM